MKLITAQEIQSMNETDLQNFFNSISSKQARSEGEAQYLATVQRSFDRVISTVDYSGYCFD